MSKNIDKFSNEIIESANRYKRKEGYLMDLTLEHEYYKMFYRYKQKDIVDEMLRINPNIQQHQGFQALLEASNFIIEHDNNVSWYQTEKYIEYFPEDVSSIFKTDTELSIKYIKYLSDIDKQTFEYFDDLDIVLFTYLVARSNLRKETFFNKDSPTTIEMMLIYVEYNRRSNYPHIEYKNMGFEPIYILPTPSQKWKEWVERNTYYPVNQFFKIKNKHEAVLEYKKVKI